jgi:hypothetical protein
MTATGTDHQWALASTKSQECASGWCATLFSRSTDGVWSLAGRLPYGANQGSDREDSVRQVRFVGNATDGYNGWAFGPGLLSTHGDSASVGASWQPVQSQTLGKYADDAIGDVTELAAREDTVYAIVAPPDSAELLISSPVDHDDWTAVDVGTDVGRLRDLNVSERVVAFVDRRGPDVGWVVSSAADPDTGAATGQWQTTKPCDEGGVERLSSTASTLWALCSDGAVFMGPVDSSGMPTWSEVSGGAYDPAGQIAARDASTALVAQLHGLFEVSARAGQDRRIGPESFTNASVFGFTNEHLGFVVIDGELLRTEDGGTTWRQDPVLPPA